MKFFIPVVALCLVPALAISQDGKASKLTAAGFEKIIKQGWKKDFDKKQLADGVFNYDIKDTPFYALYNGPKKFINIYVQAPAKTTLERINEWNRDAIFSRAYMVKNVVQFEVTLNIAAELTDEMVNNYYEAAEGEFKKFAEFLK